MRVVLYVGLCLNVHHISQPCFFYLFICPHEECIHFSFFSQKGVQRMVKAYMAVPKTGIAIGKQIDSSLFSSN